MAPAHSASRFPDRRAAPAESRDPVARFASATAPSSFSTAGVCRNASRIVLSRDCNSCAVCSVPFTARYSFAILRRNSSCAARSAAVIPRRSLGHNFERLRRRQLRNRAVHFLEHAHRIISREHQRPHVGRIRKISLFPFVRMSVHPRRRIPQIPRHPLKSRVVIALHAPDRAPRSRHTPRNKLPASPPPPPRATHPSSDTGSSDSSSPLPSPPPAAFLS